MEFGYKVKKFTESRIKTERQLVLMNKTLRHYTMMTNQAFEVLQRAAGRPVLVRKCKGVIEMFTLKFNQLKTQPHRHNQCARIG
jgi:hypothetical protein